MIKVVHNERDLVYENNIVSTKICHLSVCLVSLFFVNLFSYSAYFCYYLWVSLHFLVLFINFIILFQLIFTFIYRTFSQKVFSFNKISKS